MKEIFLTQGQVAIVDNRDYKKLSKYKWQASKPRNIYYATRQSLIVNGERHTIFMHHEIIGKPLKGFHADYRDGNGLNNQRNNLRHVTVRQNGQNLIHGERYSQYPGVSWHKRDQKWVAMIRINGPQKWLGTFNTEIEAFEAYRHAVNAIGEEILNTK